MCFNSEHDEGCCLGSVLNYLQNCNLALESMVLTRKGMRDMHTSQQLMYVTNPSLLKNINTYEKGKNCTLRTRISKSTYVVSERDKV